MSFDDKEYLIYVKEKGFYSYINYNPERLAHEDFFFKEISSRFHLMTYQDVKTAIIYLCSRYNKDDIMILMVSALRLPSTNKSASSLM